MLPRPADGSAERELHPDANERLGAGIPVFRDYIAQLNLAVPAGSPLDSQLHLVENYFTHRSAPVLTSLSDKELEDWYFAMTTVIRLVESVNELVRQPEGRMRRMLKTILESDLTQDFMPNPGKDLLYELEIAAWLEKMRFNVVLEEPDVRASGNGLSREIGFACKFPSSDKQIQDKITEGYRQLRRHQVPGLVAIGLDQIAFAALKSEGLNADNADAASRAADALLGRWVVQAIRDRKGLVAEVPLDGAIFTLNVLVVLNEEHGLAFLRRVGFQTETDQHPLKADLGLLAAGTKLLLG